MKRFLMLGVLTAALSAGALSNTADARGVRFGVGVGPRAGFYGAPSVGYRSYGYRPSFSGNHYGHYGGYGYGGYGYGGIGYGGIGYGYSAPYYAPYYGGYGYGANYGAALSPYGGLNYGGGYYGGFYGSPCR